MVFDCIGEYLLCFFDIFVLLQFFLIINETAVNFFIAKSLLYNTSYLLGKFLEVEFFVLKF